MGSTAKSGIRRWLGRLCLIFMLTTVSVAVVSGSDIPALSTVQAAATQKIRFTDGSGKYLEKIGNKYYLRNKKGKKLTGIQHLKIPKTGCHSTLHPSSSSRQTDGYSNTASAKDCGLLLERIYNGTCVSKTYSQKMLNLLLNQTRRWKIPAGIPSGVKVANKTGETSSTQHDMAIVFGPKADYIICVFSSGCSEYTGCNGIKNISSKVYSYLN